MAVSDQLTKLATRAKEAEDRAAAAQGKARADLGLLRAFTDQSKRSHPAHAKSWSRSGADAAVSPADGAVDSTLGEGARPEGTVPVLPCWERGRLLRTHLCEPKAGSLANTAPTSVR